MRGKISLSRKKLGKPPGTLVHVGEKKIERVKISILRYDEKSCEEKVIDSIEEVFKYFQTDGVCWLNIDGIHDVQIIKEIGSCLDIDPLVLEDILNTKHRPKFEVFDNYIYIVLKMMTFDSESRELKSEQISIVLGPNYVITFQEIEGDVFDPVRKRIANPNGRFRKSGPDYLTYALIDTIVDNYFPLADQIKDQLEEIEEGLLEKPDIEILHNLHYLRRELVRIRKNIRPVREVISGFERAESGLIKTTTKKYIRDVLDHVIQITDTFDSVRDLLTGLQEMNLTVTSNRMNEVMKVLAIFATVFIPLTFIAGVYGMNFDLMPELKWPWGYPLALGLMAAVGISMFISFKLKKWI